MSKGVIYIMTTAVSGLIKIGKTQSKQYQERMRFLEANGYYNVVGLKRCFAIEVEDYDAKESLLHEIFAKHRVGSSELFALEYDLVQQLLLSFDGTVIFPSQQNKEKTFEKITKVRQQGQRFSFYKKGIQDGDTVSFVNDNSITAVVVGEREVECGGQIWHLSPLARKIFEDKGRANASGAYQGAAYFTFNGVKLKDLPDIDNEK